MNYKKMMMILLTAIIVLILIIIVFLIGKFAFDDNRQNEGEGEVQISAIDNNKDPSEYTWEDFEALSAEKQMEFQNSFKNPEDFEKWMEKVQNGNVDIPWENGGKAPSEYTWEEFEALTAYQQIKFQNSFENSDDFEKWMEEAQNKKNDAPWETGGKKPENYTWEEFEELPPDQQMEFQNSFENSESFENWMEESQQGNNISAGNDAPAGNDKKEPSEYTWKEFEAMTPEQQMEFQNSFKNADDFEKWMESATGNGKVDVSFEKDDLFSVTWKEFEAMSMEEQMIFQNSFKNIEEFDKWLKANKPE